MYLRSIIKTALLMQLAVVPATLPAQIQTKKVSFPAGKSSTTLTGTIKGEKTIDYLITAKEGQQMSVTLTSKNSSLYFNVLPPGSNEEAIFIGSTEGNTFTGTLSASGEYKLRVFLYRNAARRNESASYNISLSVTGAVITGG